MQVDSFGRTTLRNSAAERLRTSHSGYLIEEAIERHLASALKGSPSEETLEFFGPPKQVVVVRTVSLPGGGAVAFADDISERHRLDAMRTDFVANISHELKTPVGAMAVLADALTGEDDSEMVQRLVGRMVFEAERAARTSGKPATEALRKSFLLARCAGVRLATCPTRSPDARCQLHCPS